MHILIYNYIRALRGVYERRMQNDQDNKHTPSFDLN